MSVLDPNYNLKHLDQHLIKNLNPRTLSHHLVYMSSENFATFLKILLKHFKIALREKCVEYQGTQLCC
jgi:hypothetical protein